MLTGIEAFLQDFTAAFKARYDEGIQKLQSREAACLCDFDAKTLKDEVVNGGE